MLVDGNPLQGFGYKMFRTLSRDVLEKNSLDLVLHVSLDDCKPTSTNIVALKT
jgi:hypothetical protein